MNAASSCPVSFSEAERKLARWRQSSRRGKAMPEELWSLAVTLALEHGVSKTASSLRLGYYALKERVAAASAPSVAERRPAFVEVALGSLSAAATPCVVELLDGRGVKLRVELPERAAGELAAVARTLWAAAR
jgi:hypothetical protein